VREMEMVESVKKETLFHPFVLLCCGRTNNQREDEHRDLEDCRIRRTIVVSLRIQVFRW